MWNLRKTPKFLQNQISRKSASITFSIVEFKGNRMQSRVQKLFPTLLLFSTLFTTLVPFTPAKSQTLEIARQQLQASSQPKTVKTPPQKMSQANLLAEEVKPSVVRIGVGYKAKLYLPKNGKIYHLEQMISYGTGFFINHNGYIATAAHVTDLTLEDCKQLLWRELALKLEADGENLDDVEQELK